MRKLMAFMMALALLFTSAAIAEELPQVHDVALIEYDFGDFTMTFPEDLIGDVYDKVNNQPLLILYQDYDTTPTRSLSIVWNETYVDLTAADPTEFGQVYLEASVAASEMMGVEVTNPALLGAEMGEQDGKPALSLVYSYDMDYTGAGADLKITQYMMQGVVSNENMGTYTFTIGTDDLEAVMPLMEIMDTVKWND